MKLLLIEDDQEIAESLSEGLEAFSYTISHHSTGQAGLQSALDELYDLIILDWMLPDGSGLDLCKSLRDQGVETPILMLTARSQVADRVAGLDAGADDYLSKPFAFRELLARLRALSRRQPRLDTDLIQIGDFCLDAQKMTVTRAGKLVHLAPKEYELLEYLARNRNQVLDKYQILDRVWLHQTDAVANTVEVFVGYLRKKLDKNFPDSAPLIHTIRGKGYLFGER